LGYDLGRDAKMLDDFDNDAYWLLDNTDEKYVISSVPQVSDDLSLNLGVSLESEKEVTFTLDATTSFSKDLYLLDKQTNQITNLREGDHTTSVSSGDHMDRFSLVFKSTENLKIEGVAEKGHVEIYHHDDHLNISSETATIKKVNLYDINGREVLDYDVSELTKSVRLSLAKMSQSLMIIKVNTSEGIFTKKLFLE